MAKRPLLITVIGILFFIAAIALLITAIGCLVPDIAKQIAQELIDQGVLSNETTLDEAISYVHSMSIIVFVIAFATAFIGFGFFKGWAFIWYISLIFFGLLVLASIISLIDIKQWTAGITMVIGIVVIYYLFRPSVKEFFDI